MERIRFNRSDALFIAICLVIIAVGLWISLTRFHEAFPEAINRVHELGIDYFWQ